MPHNIEPIPLTKIDTEDDTYRITTRSSTDDLTASMQRVGLLNPPLLAQKAGGYIPVSGFRRIAACRRLNYQTVEAGILDKETPRLQEVMIAVSDNTLQRKLNLIETARALRLLTQYVPDPTDRVRLSADLGLPNNPNHIEKIIKLLKLPTPVQSAVADDTVSLSIAMAMDRFEPDAAIYLCRLFCDLKLGFNKQREILTRVEEIAAREGISASRLLHCRAFQSIVSHKDSDRTQKQQSIRKYLKQRRYPHMTKSEAQFESNRKHLNLGRHITLEPPAYFEDRAYTLKIQFVRLSELAEHVESLHELVKNPSMEKILRGSP